MSRATRIVLPLAVLVAAVVLFIVLKPSDDKSNQNEQSATTSSGKPGSPAPIPKVTVKNGKPVGGVRELDFGSGDTVRFRVVSDVADEVHVHGYDLMKDVKPGHPITFSFKGDQDGEYAVELESRGEQIASLKVAP